MDKDLGLVDGRSSPVEFNPQPEDAPTKKPGTFIRYRTEYRDRLSGDLLSRRDTEATATEGIPDDDAPHEDEEDKDPVFEIITTIKTRLKESDAPGKVAATLSKPQYRMNIYSAAIINALESVVRYYPSQSLGTDPVRVDWPYPVLVHHYDELTMFRDDAKEKGPDEGCHLERQSVEHLTLLLSFLDHTVMPRVREEQERNKRGYVTWEYEWVSLRPGAVRLSLLHGEEDWHGQVIHSIKDGAFVDPPQPWTINSWSMDYDGQWLGRRISETVMDKFDGEVALEKSNIVLNEEHFKNNGENLPEPAKRKAEFGRPYLELLEKTCKYLKGPSRQFPYNEHDGLVMVDMKAFFEDNRYHKPMLMDQSDCRPTFADGSCVYCNNLNREKGIAGEKSLVGLYEEFNTLTPDDARIEGNLFLHLLCPIQVYVFALKTREWEPVHVQHLADPIFEEGMINELVMDQGRKNTLTSLAKSFARRNKHGVEVSQPIWSADFVKGKGNGLIFLLHGRPGVGKTCTAECIAAFTRRPLMVLTPSDVGNTPADVEINLTKMFKRAVSWGAVLLVDEADVFMERRSTSDLARNSLVASFLRALENYDGILFLTTNRIGSFDDAFISRVHIQLYYPEFTDKEREMVWKTFIDKLQRDRGDHIRLHISAKEYISGKEMQAVEWNGREIRNALQTAVALAEYDAERGEDGKIIITDTHLKAIVDLSADFKKYLNSLHEGDESKRAERKFERLDDYDRKR